LVKTVNGNLLNLISHTEFYLTCLHFICQENVEPDESTGNSVTAEANKVS